MLQRTVIGLLAAVITLLPGLAAAAEVVVYSARKEHLVKPLFDAYTKKTGTEIKYVTDKAGPLLARLQAEGSNTPADMLITVDAGNLWQAAKVGVLGSVESTVLDANIPAHLRDEQGRWYGLSVRARTIVYSTDRVRPGDLSTYEDLADPKWKGRLCLRTSKKVYNQSLVAMMIAELGSEATEKVVKGWVSNLATAPFSNDTKAMKAVVAGRCDVTIVNTYYFGRLQKKEPGIELAIFWPNQQGSGDSGRGVHVNVSGAGVTANAPHRAEAIELLEWFSTEQAQRLFADLNLEYPANPKVSPAAEVAAWGEFKADAINIAEAGRLQREAVMLMDRAGYR